MAVDYHRRVRCGLRHGRQQGVSVSCRSVLSETVRIANWITFGVGCIARISGYAVTLGKWAGWKWPKSLVGCIMRLVERAVRMLSARVADWAFEEGEGKTLPTSEACC